MLVLLRALGVCSSAYRHRVVFISLAIDKEGSCTGGNIYILVIMRVVGIDQPAESTGRTVVSEGFVYTCVRKGEIVSQAVVIRADLSLDIKRKEVDVTHAAEGRRASVCLGYACQGLCGRRVLDILHPEGKGNRETGRLHLISSFRILVFRCGALAARSHHQYQG